MQINPQGLTEQNLLLLVMLLLGLGVVAVVLYLIRRVRGPKPGHINRVTGYQRHRSDDPNWFFGGLLFIGLIMVFAWRDAHDSEVIQRVAAERAAIEAGYLPPSRARVTVDLNVCPPRTDGMTGQVVMSFDTHHTDGPLITGCTRIGQRQFQAEHRGVKG